MTTNPANVGHDVENDAPEGDGRALFTFRGQSFRCVSYVPMWNMMRLADAMEGSDEMRAMGAMYRFIRYLVIPEEHDRLEDHMGRVDFEDTDELEHAIGDALVEIAGRGKVSGPPVGIRESVPSSGPRSGGSTETAHSHRVVSLSRGTVREESAPAPIYSTD